MRRLIWMVLVLCGVTATLVSAASVHFAWDYTQGSKPAVGFHFYRAATCAGPFTKLTTTALPLTPLTYTDASPGLVTGQTYCWKVTAIAADGEEVSGPSSSLTFLLPVQTAPENLHVTGTTQ